ncbi:hypothetical protein HN832_03460 [archaeon]|nr:hypothetical protein [archaeon]MBT4373546.1 hypothetical protein [archaeon]MBT4531994.1 hypothetical protein [archaeon]MBT7001661.1 hypothetical protein [archaeon]MBT7282447.1 hypothetical protein [archaeon]
MAQIYYLNSVGRRKEVKLYSEEGSNCKRIGALCEKNFQRYHDNKRKMSRDR